MADPTLVNGQITDAVTQANVKVLADAPAEALAMVYQTMGQSVGLGMQNATAAQQQMNTVKQAVTTQCANLIMAMDTAATGRATLQVMTGNSLATQLAQLLTSVASGQQAVKAAYGTPPTHHT
ncbi:MAG: R body protein [Candidatus Entotheonella factor]|uniref:R body protein n=1 Tax=Entotheonella factor TaxID=1429438 RepID=W4L232_ENTF1|nr:MAG: R body protein [Candidatus Entotheonella factor]